MKNNKKLIIALYSIIAILSFVCIASIVYNFIGGFYQSRISKFETSLGESKTINVTSAGSFNASFSFSGTTLLGDNIKQEIFVKSAYADGDLTLRAKVEVANMEDTKSMLFGFTNWLTQEDNNYIYFNQPLRPNEKVGLCKYIRISDELKLESSKNYILVVTVEAFAA